LINSNENLVKDIYYIIFFTVFFTIGLFDDLVNLKPNSKIIVIFLLSLLFVSLSNDTKLIEIKLFLNGNNEYYYKNFNSIFLSSIFLTSLIIVFNLIDGANGVALVFFSICVFFLNLNNEFNFFVICFYIINIFSYFVINLKNKSFLGSSGNIILSLILYLSLIGEYNNNNKFDLIYLMIFLFLPYIDAARLFIIRALNKKSPFEPDKNHFHHYLINNQLIKKSYLFALSLVISIPLILIYILNFNATIVLIISLIVYFLLIYWIRRY
jgi:UDP-GlcNAc:undecaprenyl-phosphate GlcNAc-1-phosphate transferase